MLDINWRILRLHRALLRRAQSGTFTDATRVDRDLTGIEFKFPGLHPRPLQPRPAAVRHLCRPIQHRYCRRVLPEFRAALRERSDIPKDVRLNLSTLHAGHFERLLANLRESAASPHREQDPPVDLLIHHVGGWKLYGLYEIPCGEKHNAGPGANACSRPRIRTICKDAYLSKSRNADPDGPPVENVTHFERWQRESTDAQRAQMARAASCAGLYAETGTAE